MVIIKLPSGSDWYKVNWVYRQLRSDVATMFPQEERLLHLMELGQAFGMLDLKTMEYGARASLLRVLATVASATVDGALAGWRGSHPDDGPGCRMYRESMLELTQLIDGETASESHE